MHWCYPNIPGILFAVPQDSCLVCKGTSSLESPKTVKSVNWGMRVCVCHRRRKLAQKCAAFIVFVTLACFKALNPNHLSTDSCFKSLPGSKIECHVNSKVSIISRTLNSVQREYPEYFIEHIWSWYIVWTSGKKATSKNIKCVKKINTFNYKQVKILLIQLTFFNYLCLKYMRQKHSRLESLLEPRTITNTRVKV